MTDKLEQAIEKIEKAIADPVGGVRLRINADRIRQALKEVREVRAEQQKTCTWTEDEWDGSWSTQCGERFSLIDGGPKDNRMVYCHYCKRIIQEVRPETDDDS